MAVVRRSSRARVVGRSSDVRSEAYVSVSWERERGSRERRRSFWCCCAERAGRLAWSVGVC